MLPENENVDDEIVEIPLEVARVIRECVENTDEYKNVNRLLTFEPIGLKNQRKIVLTAICQSTILTTNNFQKGRCYGKTYSRYNIHGHQ
ncbi:hypothetical protein [Butyrivibrio sp. YAB3001]|uniref:hypothetical protein n=1 Tax=Butyrivibrio sp. YAB3001 TaxID=1520812 RepID=UPI0008F64373|nr:hypothetical protein [Butyrivibrio sp. YAB3001]SFC03425.1 hypothetical protein SAMN02910398_01382 [Butyrivibrio sp. YAB3001]